MERYNKFDCDRVIVTSLLKPRRKTMRNSNKKICKIVYTVAFRIGRTWRALRNLMRR
jgi:hypothetical protein